MTVEVQTFYLKGGKGVIPPGWKKPLDVLETIENKVTGLIAAGAVVPFTMAAMSKLLVGSSATAGGMTPTGLAMLPIGTMDLSGLLNILTVPLGVAIFLVVWLASHAINVLIILSPWGAIDAALKSARTAALGILVGRTGLRTAPRRTVLPRSRRTLARAAIPSSSGRG